MTAPLEARILVTPPFAFAVQMYVPSKQMSTAVPPVVYVPTAIPFEVAILVTPAPPEQVQMFEPSEQDGPNELTDKA